MTTTTTTRRRPSRIGLPDGEELEPRKDFGREALGVSDRTPKRYNFPTVYVGGVPYVKRKASLQIISGRAKRQNQPARRRQE